MKTLEWLATILTACGFWLISAKLVTLGFAISFVSNILWIIWGGKMRAYGLIALNLALAAASINGINTN